LHFAKALGRQRTYLKIAEDLIGRLDLREQPIGNIRVLFWAGNAEKSLGSNWPDADIGGAIRNG
jgi:hypothetical protein